MPKRSSSVLSVPVLVFDGSKNEEYSCVGATKGPFIIYT